MSEQPTIHHQWLQDSMAQFEHADELAMRVGHENEIFSELVEDGALTIKPFKDVASEHLFHTQQATLRELNDTQKPLPYERVGETEVTLANRLTQIRDDLNANEAKIQVDASKIHEEGQLVVGKIPELASRVSEIAAELERELARKAIAALQEEQVELAQAHHEITENELFWKAWPLPRLAEMVAENADDIAIATAEDEADIEEVVQIDQFPEDPNLLTHREIAEKVRRKHSEEVLRDASEFTALLLAEVPARVFTQVELGELLYSDVVENKTSRVSALISNFVLGKTSIIGEKLAASSLVFQYGERRWIDKQSGEKVGRCQPVYRAVTPEHAQKRERLIYTSHTEQWEDAAWHTVSKLPLTTRSERKRDELPPELAQIEAALIFRPVAPTTQIEPESSAPRKHFVRGSMERKKVKTWEAGFKKDVEEVIEHFEADDLMVEGRVSRTIMSIKSSSTSMATDRMFERAISLGIITRSEAEGDLSLEKYVCMALQNRHRNLFGHRSRGRRAKEIVAESVGRYFSEQPSAAIDNAA